MHGLCNEYKNCSWNLLGQIFKIHCPLPEHKFMLIQRCLYIPGNLCKSLCSFLLPLHFHMIMYFHWHACTYVFPCLSTFYTFISLHIMFMMNWCTHPRFGLRCVNLTLKTHTCRNMPWPWAWDLFYVLILSAKSLLTVPAKCFQLYFPQ